MKIPSLSKGGGEGGPTAEANTLYAKVGYPLSVPDSANLPSWDTAFHSAVSLGTTPQSDPTSFHPSPLSARETTSGYQR